MIPERREELKQRIIEAINDLDEIGLDAVAEKILQELEK